MAVVSNIELYNGSLIDSVTGESAIITGNVSFIEDGDRYYAVAEDATRDNNNIHFILPPNIKDYTLFFDIDLSALALEVLPLNYYKPLIECGTIQEDIDDIVNNFWIYPASSVQPEHPSYNVFSIWGDYDGTGGPMYLDCGTGKILIALVHDSSLEGNIFNCYLITKNNAISVGSINAYTTLPSTPFLSRNLFIIPNHPISFMRMYDEVLYTSNLLSVYDDYINKTVNTDITNSIPVHLFLEKHPKNLYNLDSTFENSFIEKAINENNKKPYEWIEHSGTLVANNGQINLTQGFATINNTLRYGTREFVVNTVTQGVVWFYGDYVDLNKNRPYNGYGLAFNRTSGNDTISLECIKNGASSTIDISISIEIVDNIQFRIINTYNYISVYYRLTDSNNWTLLSTVNQNSSGIKNFLFGLSNTTTSDFKVSNLRAFNTLHSDYCLRALDYFNAAIIPFSDEDKAALNSWFYNSDKIIEKLDVIYLSGARTEQQSLLNMRRDLVNSSGAVLHDATKVNSPTFVSGKGWSGNATNYINTGFNPGDGGTYKLIRDNATIGFYSNNTKATGSRCWASNYFGSLHGLSVGIYSDNRRVLGEVNRDSNSSVITTTVLVKEFMHNRRSSGISASRGFNNKINSYSYSSDPVRNEVVKCSISGDRGCLFYVGSFLTDQELSNFQDTTLPLLEHFGGDYWSNYSNTTLTATPLSDTQIKLDWVLPVVTYSPYTISNIVIEYSLDNINFETLTTLAGNIITYTATLNSNTTYYFKIKLISSRNIISSNSNTVTCKTFIENAQTYFSAMSVQLTAPQKTVIDTFMSSQVNTLAKLDCVLWDFGTEQRALLYMNDPSKSATKVNSPTYTPYKGWIGTHTDYINTFNPGDGGTYNFKKEDASLLVYVNVKLHSTGSPKDIIFLSSPTQAIRLRAVPSGLTGGINGPLDAGHTSLYMIDDGNFISMRRNNSTQHTANIGFTKQTVNTLAQDIGNADFDFRCNSRIPFIFIGAYLTDQELSDFQDAALPVLEYFGQDFFSNYSPDAPTTTVLSDGSIKLDWIIPDTTYSPYFIINTDIEYSTDNINYNTLSSSVSNTYTVSGLNPNSTYYFRLKFLSNRSILSSAGTAISATTFSTISYEYFAAMSEQLPIATKKVIDEWINGLDEAGILATPDNLDGLDFLRLHLPTEQASLLNVNQLFPQYNCTKVNSPNFSEKGWTGNTSNYINTNYNAGDGLEHSFKQDNATIGYYTNKYRLAYEPLIIGTTVLTSVTTLRSGIGMASSSAVMFQLNASSGNATSNRITSCRIIRRENQSQVIYSANKEKSIHEILSSGIDNKNIVFSKSEERTVVEFIGSHLTDAQMNIFQDLTLPVLEHLGSDYWSNYVPTTLALTVNSSTSISLAWTNPVTTYSPYTQTNVIVERSTDGVNYTTLTTLGLVTSYEDTTCSNGTLYYYRLKFVSSRNITTSAGTAVSARTIEYVDYIQSNGTQYINTGVIITKDIRLIGELKNLKTGSIIEGHYDQDGGAPNTRNLCLFQATTGSVNFYFGNLAHNTGNTTLLDVFTKVELGKQLLINDVLTRTFATDGQFDGNSILYLFRAYKEYNSSLVGAGSIRRKTIEVYNGATLQIKLQPSLNLSGQFCMFDEVSKTYKLNEGTGIFTGGGVTSARIDILLNRYAADGVASVIIDFRGSDNGTRSSASDAAVTTLTAAGCTILVNP